MTLYPCMPGGRLRVTWLRSQTEDARAAYLAHFAACAICQARHAGLNALASRAQHPDLTPAEMERL